MNALHPAGRTVRYRPLPRNWSTICSFPKQAVIQGQLKTPFTGGGRATWGLFRRAIQLLFR